MFSKKAEQLNMTLADFGDVGMAEMMGDAFTGGDEGDYDMKKRLASFVAGIVLFSGSIYLLVLTKNSLWGPITPLGGICILLGWVLLILSVWLHRENRFH